jgi:hypothetical protein
MMEKTQRLSWPSVNSAPPIFAIARVSYLKSDIENFHALTLESAIDGEMCSSMPARQSCQHPTLNGRIHSAHARGFV